MLRCSAWAEAREAPRRGATFRVEIVCESRFKKLATNRAPVQPVRTRSTVFGQDQALVQVQVRACSAGASAPASRRCAYRADPLAPVFGGVALYKSWPRNQIFEMGQANLSDSR